MKQGRARQLPARMGRQLRDALADLLDQRTPFGRLALTTVLMTAGDTLLTVSLAGSLFFSITPSEAKSRVLLYLVLTMAPFAAVAPFVGQVIDRSRGARRALVVSSAGVRAVICLFMAGDLKGNLIFPEAFLMLVFSKVFLVTKGALVPLLASTSPDVTLGDSRGLRRLRPSISSPPSHLAPGSKEAANITTSSPSASVPHPVGPPVVHPGTEPAPEDALASLNARLGLLSSLTGFVASLPAIAILKLFGGGWVLYMDAAVFVAATLSGVRLPIRSSRAPHSLSPARGPGPVRRTSPAPIFGEDNAHLPYRANPGGPSATDPGGARATSYAQISEGHGSLAALGGRYAMHPEVYLARSAMTVLKAEVGFLTLFLAFALREEHAATWWFGLMLGASVAGALIGVLMVPRLRRILSEQHLLGGSLWLVAVAGALTAFVGGRLMQAVLALLVGVAGAAGKPAFDALVQRYVPDAARGRAFARYETWFQFTWVLGALVPVLATVPLVPGDIVIASVAAVGALFYLTGRRAMRSWPAMMAAKR